MVSGNSNILFHFTPAHFRIFLLATFENMWHPRRNTPWRSCTDTVVLTAYWLFWGLRLNIHRYSASPVATDLFITSRMAVLVALNDLSRAEFALKITL